MVGCRLGDKDMPWKPSAFLKVLVKYVRKGKMEGETIVNGEKRGGLVQKRTMCGCDCELAGEI